MPIEDNKRVIRRLHDLWNTGDLSKIPEVVVEQWCCIDELDRLMQLGAVPRRPQE
jgi:hypothetical protein